MHIVATNNPFRLEVIPPMMHEQGNQFDSLEELWAYEFKRQVTTEENGDSEGVDDQLSCPNSEAERRQGWYEKGYEYWNNIEVKAEQNTQ